jgi:cell filamentation protein
MYEDNTNYTPDAEENRLGLIDKALINRYEAIGIIRAEIALLTMEAEADLTIEKLFELHRIAFEDLYAWAGKWRRINVVVGQLSPPPPHQIPVLMYQFIDNLNFQIKLSATQIEHSKLMARYHHEFVRIHSFQNGNGRLGRIILNYIALKLGYEPLQLYHREGDARKNYINSLREADKGNLETLSKLIQNELISL